jgi:hypothetical protein
MMPDASEDHREKRKEGTRLSDTLFSLFAGCVPVVQPQRRIR